MSLAAIARQVERVARENSPTILTAVAVAGTITTAFLSVKAGLRAEQILRDEAIEIALHEKGRPLQIRDEVRLVWKCYIPPVITGLATIGAIVSVNRIGSRRTAALAAAYSIMESGFEEYREKVVEKLGPGKETTLRDELAQERVNRNPVGQQEIIICGNGEVLCLDGYSGRYFQSSVEEIKKAQNDINYQIIHRNYASLSDFYLLLNLPATMASEAVGWNTDNLLDIQFSTCMSEDDRPCIYVSFRVQPIQGFHKFR